MKYQSLTMETYFTVSSGKGTSVLFVSQQSPDFQSDFRTGESRGALHSHGQVRASGGKVK